MIVKIVFIVLRLCHFLPDIEILEKSLHSYAVPFLNRRMHEVKDSHALICGSSLLQLNYIWSKVIVHQRVTELIYRLSIWLRGF